MRKKYWSLWGKYASLAGISPYLDKTVPPIERDLVAGAFSARVRTGEYGRGQRTRLGGVSEALTTVSNTIDLAGQPSAFYRGDNKYQLLLERELEGFRRADPPSVPQLDVPITVPHSAFTDGITYTDPFVRHIGCLIPVAFYFLLQVGEYTKPHTVVKDGKRVRENRTKQFVVGNVGFFSQRRGDSLHGTPGNIAHSRPCNNEDI